MQGEWRLHLYACSLAKHGFSYWTTDWTLGFANQGALHVKIRRFLSLAHPSTLNSYAFALAKHGFSYWTTDWTVGFVKSAGFARENTWLPIAGAPMEAPFICVFACKTRALILNWTSDWLVGFANQGALHVKIRRFLSLAHPMRLKLYAFSMAKHGFSYWTTNRLTADWTGVC